MPEQTPRPSPETKTKPPKGKYAAWKRWLIFLLLAGVASCTALDGTLRGMLTISFDLGEDIRNVIGNQPVTGTNGTGYVEVASPGGGIGQQGSRAAGQQGNNGQGTTTNGSTPGTTGGASSQGTAGGQQGSTTTGQQGTSEVSSIEQGASSAGASTQNQVSAAPTPQTSSVRVSSAGAVPEESEGNGGTPVASSTASLPSTPQPVVITVALIGRNGNILTPGFHFTAGNAKLILDERRFTPGFYTLRVSRFDPNTGQTTTAEQEFAWGVLALNTDKDRYRPGETGKIDIGVLDEFGEIVCDAAVTLTITKPDGTITQLSTQEGTIDVTGTCGLKEAGLLIPDYTTDFTYGLVGSYEFLLEAVRPNAENNAVSTISSTVQVVTSAPYIVKRTAATRLWPFGPSTMDIEVEFLEDFSGDVTDIVPNGFQILGVEPVANTSVNEDGDTEISWSGSWSTGETAAFGYLYDAPDISPEFYLIGPLSFSGAGGESEELRQWQIANDAALKSTSYKIPTDVVASGGGDAGKSTNYLIADTIGEPGIGFGRAGNYDINAGYRQTSLGSYIATGCTDVVNLGSITFGGSATADATCSVTTDSDGGYRLSWRSGVNNNDGLVGYWPLDETTGTTAYDMSGFGRSGTHQNSPTITADTPTNYFSTRAVSFDGSNDYIESGAIGTTITEKTLAAWVKLGNLSQQGGGVIGIQRDPAITDQFDSIVFGEQIVGRWMAGSNSFSRTFNADAGTTETSTDWVHIAITYAQNDYRIYRNGVQIGRSTSYALATYPPDSKFYVGKRHASQTGPLNGFIDDARFYNRALTREEIRQLASKAPPGALTKSGSQLVNIPPFNVPSTGGLIGHWRMDEPVGGTVADASGRNNDGTPNGASGTNNTPQPSTSIPANAGFRDFRSLDFDGTDDYVTTASPITTQINDVTMSAWFRTTDYTQDRQIIVANGHGGANGYQIVINQENESAGNLRILYGGVAWYDTGVDITDSNWHHVTLVLTNASPPQKRVFLDGVLIYQNNSGTPNTPTGSTRIGTDQSSANTPYFKGNIADVRIYGRALTDAEAIALYGTPQTWSVANNAKAWGGRLKSSSTDTDSKWGTDSSSEKFLHVGDGEYTLVTRATPNHPTGSTEVIQFKAEIGSQAIQAAGVYRSVVLVTATAL